MAVLVGRESARKEVKETFQSLRRKLSDPRRKGLGGRLDDGGGGPARIPVYDWKRVWMGWWTKTRWKKVTRRVHQRQHLKFKRQHQRHLQLNNQHPHLDQQ